MTLHKCFPLDCFFFKSVNHCIAKLQLLLVLSLVLPTKQLYSCLSLNFTNQNLSFLIYPKHPHRSNAVHKTDPKKDRFMQARRLNAFFVHTTIRYIYYITDLPCSHLRLVTKEYLLKAKCCKRPALKVTTLKEFPTKGRKQSERSLRSWEGRGEKRKRDDASSEDFIIWG